MAIITISRGSYSRGKDTAERLAERLGYRCIGRDTLIEASKEFNIPEIKLIRALYDAPSVLDRFTYGKERYIKFIRRRVLESVQQDNVVYHGLAGHFFLQGIPHVCMVRIIARLEDRIREEMRREDISYEKAQNVLVKDDHERRKWARHLYGIDTSDASLYDLVLHVNKFDVEDAVDIIAHTINRPCFQTTQESREMLDRMVLCAKVESELAGSYPNAKCLIQDGTAHLTLKETPSKKDKVDSHVRELLKDSSEIKNIEVHLEPVAP